MCRSVAQGGRRCRGGKCAESRRARQRSYQSRRRKRNVLSTLLSSVPQDPMLPSTTPRTIEMPQTPIELVPSLLSEKERAERSAKIAEMRDAGRFKILDDGISTERREEIRVMSRDEAISYAEQLREDLDVDLTLNSLDKDCSPEEIELAKQVATLLGDVTVSWMEGQTAEQEVNAAVLIDEFEKDIRTFHDFTPAKEREYRKLFEDRATELAAARYEVFTEYLDGLVGTDMDINANIRKSAPKNVRENMSWASRVIPNAFKRNAEQRCQPLNVYPMGDGGRGGYNAGTSCTVTYTTSTVYEDESAVIASVVTDEVKRHPVKIPGTDMAMPMKLGGIAGNADHEAEIMNTVTALNNFTKSNLALARRTNQATALPDNERIEFERGVTEDGYLTVVQRRVTLHQEVSQGNTLMVSESPSMVLHELGHRVQHANPHMWVVEAADILERDGGKEKSQYFADPEPVFKDHFPEHYSGKVYHGLNATELFTTGLEAAFTGAFGAGSGVGLSGEKHVTVDDRKRYPSDRRHLLITLGLLAGAPRHKP